jgi:hypothetical protein
MSSIASKIAPLFSLLAVAGCGGSDKAAAEEPAAAPAVATPAAPGAKDGLQVSGTRGVLQNEQIHAGLSPHAVALEACYRDALKQKKFLVGRVVLEVQVDKAGRVSRAGIADGDLGDWTVERCLVDEASKMTFAKPAGGDGSALFKVPLDFTSDQPAIEEWPDAQVASVVTARAAELSACGAATGVTATAYIGNRGAVQAVGFTASPPVDPVWADCAARAIGTWTFADPLGKVVKATFSVGGAAAEPAP